MVWEVVVLTATVLNTIYGLLFQHLGRFKLNLTIVVPGSSCEYLFLACSDNVVC